MSLYMAMPQDFNEGYFPVSGRPKYMNTLDVISYASGSIWSENTQRARDFLGLALPEQDENIRAMVEASRAQREKRLMLKRLESSKKVKPKKKASWRHSYR